MKYFQISSAFLVLLSLLVIQCTDEITVSVPFNKETVIFGSLTNENNFVSLNIQQSVPLNSSATSEMVNNATISVFERAVGSEAVLLTNNFVANNGNYTSLQPINVVVGNAYWIAVELEDGTSFVSAEETLKEVVAINALTIKTDDILEIGFQDPANDRNFYSYTVELLEDNTVVSTNFSSSNDVIFDGNNNASVQIDLFREVGDEEEVIYPYYNNIRASLNNINFSSYQFYLNQSLQNDANQSEGGGPDQLFATPPINLIGNLKNTTTNNLALGNFVVNAVSIESIIVNNTVNQGSDPNFFIEQNKDTEFAAFSKKVSVFGIPIYGVSGVENAKLLHAANILAQYLDNNEDGQIDNSLILEKMIQNNAYLVMWKNDSDLENLEQPENSIGQDLGNDETVPSWHSNGHSGNFDAAIEEVWHLVTNAGLSKVYPSIFAETGSSKLTLAMDIARGGKFTEIPAPYPTEAWYTYADQTCDYNCMAGEYVYWAMSSILGAQENRLGDIQEEWRLHTKALVAEKDKAVYKILTDSQYKLPTVLPDGTYRH